MKLKDWKIDHYIQMTNVSAPNGMQFKWVCIFQPVSANVEGTIQNQGTTVFPGIVFSLE